MICDFASGCFVSVAEGDIDVYLVSSSLKN